MYKNILIATDGSRTSRKMVQEGVKLAKALDARVTGVHVYPAHFGLTYGNVGVIDARTQARLRAIARKEGERHLEQVRQAAERAGVACETLLLERDQVWKAIIDTARKRRCDVILMAAHSRGPLARLVLGSETNKVLMNSKIPVLVYR